MTDSPYAPAPTTLRVRGDTATGSFSKMLRVALDEHARVTVRAMGGDAVNQMVKGLITAQRDLAAQGKRLRYTHAFDTRIERGNEITAVQTVCTVEDLG